MQNIFYGFSGASRSAAPKDSLRLRKHSATLPFLIARGRRGKMIGSRRRNMSDSYIQNLFAERIGGRQYGKSTAIYKFEKIKRAKRAAVAARPEVDLIDMGV